MKKKKLIIFGVQDFAQIAYEYFTHDSEYEVVAFTVDAEYVTSLGFCGLPLISFEALPLAFPPEDHEMYCAVVYGNLNRDREAICKRAKDAGYRLASYVSSRAFVWPNVKMGEHNFIFENNTVQPFVTLGDNNILWSGNHAGHHSILGNNIFVSSHVVISGWCNIGNHCFLGVNSTLGNNTVVGKDSWISMGAIVNGVIPDHSFVRSLSSDVSILNDRALFRSLERARQ